MRDVEYLLMACMTKSVWLQHWGERAQKGAGDKVGASTEAGVDGVEGSYLVSITAVTETELGCFREPWS